FASSLIASESPLRLQQGNRKKFSIMKNFLIKAVFFDKELASLRNGGDAGGVKCRLITAQA
ncbi:MAG: hypothetical protein EA344_01275, partial [Alkalicoccus sp.]